SPPPRARHDCGASPPGAPARFHAARPALHRDVMSKIPVRSAAPTPLDGVELSTVNEDSIRRLVHEFYDAVRRDDVIGPIFLARIAPGRWPFHLNRMCDFWSSVLLRTGRYQGQPLPPHLRIP